MPIHELRRLVRTIAISSARDEHQQLDNLRELHEVWSSQLDHGSTAEIDSYFEFAIELVRYLAEGRTPGPEEVLTLVTRFLARAEATMARPKLSHGPADIVLKLPEDPDAEEPIASPEPLSLVEDPPEPRELGLVPRATREEDRVGLSDIVLGELLIHMGIVSSSEIKSATQQQDDKERIGQTCIRLGYATEEQIQEATQLQGHLRSHATKPLPARVQDRGAVVMEWQQSLLGEVLVNTEVITRPQLKQALQSQRASGLLLGEVLVKMGACDWNAVRGAICVQEEFRKQAEDSRKDFWVA